MNTFTSPNLSEDGFPSILALNAVVLSRRIHATSLAVLIWGIINLANWFMSYSAEVSALRSAHIPVEKVSDLLFAGLVLAIIMIAVGGLGLRQKRLPLGVAAALLILAVGIWNVVQDNLILDRLQTFGMRPAENRGYNHEPVNLFTEPWMFLAALQIMWGIKELVGLAIISARPQGVSRNDAMTASQFLTNTIEHKDRGGYSSVIGTVFSQETFPFPRESSTEMVVFLLSNAAVAISAGMSRIDIFSRDALRGCKMPADIAVIKSIYGRKATIKIHEQFLEIFKSWACVTTQAEEVAQKAIRDRDKAIEQASREADRQRMILSSLKSSERLCEHCGTKYCLADYDQKATIWSCSSCKMPISKS